MTPKDFTRFLPLLLAIACSKGTDDAPAATDSSRATTVTGANGSVAAASDRRTWTVTEQGYGPIHAGMTLAEARSALGDTSSIPAPGDSTCDHVTPAFAAGAEPAMLFMIEQGKIARVEVRDASVATAAGARVGDARSRIESLYPGRVRVEPHKYTEGKYLIVPLGTGADSLFRLVFETDDKGKVITFRSGLYPQVQWVEGCS
ncbi:MAG: hypothetical protein ACJ8AD_08555 [Gemmatimonadaceae bacterium]